MSPSRSIAEDEQAMRVGVPFSRNKQLKCYALLGDQALSEPCIISSANVYFFPKYSSGLALDGRLKEPTTRCSQSPGRGITISSRQRNSGYRESARRLHQNWQSRCASTGPRTASPCFCTPSRRSMGLYATAQREFLASWWEHDGHSVDFGVRTRCRVDAYCWAWLEGSR